jgi:hypothetical protein
LTKDEIVELAKQAGLLPLLDQDCFETLGTKNFTLTKKVLEQFAKLIVANNPPDSQMTWHEGYEAGVANEREACAKLVEDSWMAFSKASNVRLNITPFPELSHVAKVIRARGQK